MYFKIKLAKQSIIINKELKQRNQLFYAVLGFPGVGIKYLLEELWFYSLFID